MNQADNSTLVIAVVTAVLGAPFLNFLLQFMRRNVDKDNTIVTGAGDAVDALSEALKGVRTELSEVRRDLDGARAQLDSQAGTHRRQIDEMRQQHEREIEDIRREHREEMRLLEARLTGNH